MAQVSSLDSIRCPVCSSTVGAVVPHRWRPDHVFFIRSPSECKACGTCFIPKSGWGVRIVVITLGLAFSAGAVLLDIVPSVGLLWSNGWSGRLVFHILLATTGAGFGLWMIVVAVRSRRSLVVQGTRFEDRTGE